VQQASLGDLRLEQDQDAVSVVGVLGAPRLDAGLCQALVDQPVQRGAQADSNRVAALQATESLDIGCEDAAMHWLDGH
jgi:hypothetical protein